MYNCTWTRENQRQSGPVHTECLAIIYRFLENLCSGASVRGDGCTGRHPRSGDCLRRGDFSSELLPPRGEPGGGQGGYDRGPVESVAQRGQG